MRNFILTTYTKWVAFKTSLTISHLLQFYAILGIIGSITVAICMLGILGWVYGEGSIFTTLIPRSLFVH